MTRPAEDQPFRWGKPAGTEENLKQQRSCFHLQSSGNWQYSCWDRCLKVDYFSPKPSNHHLAMGVLLSPSTPFPICVQALGQEVTKGQTMFHTESLSRGYLLTCGLNSQTTYRLVQGQVQVVGNMLKLPRNMCDIYWTSWILRQASGEAGRLWG